MDDGDFHTWMLDRSKIEKADPRWPYLVWRYEKEFALRVLANVWAFPSDWLVWADVQIRQGSRPWVKRQLSLEERRAIVARLREKGVVSEQEAA